MPTIKKAIYLKNIKTSKTLNIINNIFLFGTVILIIGLSAFNHKIYYKLLSIFLFVPAFFIITTNYKVLLTYFKTSLYLYPFIFLITWAAISLNWSTDIEETKELKKLFYILLFTLGCFISIHLDPKRFENILFISCLLLAFLALISIIAYPWRDLDIPDRMSSFYLLENPIIAGYAMGIAFIVIHLHPSHNNTYTKGIRYLALLILLIFIIWTKSRGAISSLLIYLLITPVLSKQKINNYWITFIILFSAICVLILFNDLIIDRGLSFRPYILQKSIQIILDNPLTGLGLGARYQIPFNQLLFFSHAHNLFLHTGIGLGIVGLVLYSILWINTGWIAWKNSYSTLGNILLGIFIFSSIALQFDGITLWEKPNTIWLMSWLPIAMGFYLNKKCTNSDN